MFSAIIRFSVSQKLFIGLLTFVLLVSGIYAMLTLPVDAVPDITNNQVQIVTISPALAPQEVEQLITFPIEIAMSNIMNVEEIRSVSRFGMSLVTVVFKESVPILDARQLINEQIQSVAGEIPSELGTPEMMPITTGLGEIYQYYLAVAPEYEHKYDAMELRTIQDWIVKRQLSGIPGIVEINSFGGHLKQYEVAVDPDALYSLNITIGEVFEALSVNNQNTGGGYIEKGRYAYYIRSEGMIHSLGDIEQIVVTSRGGIPIHIHDVGTVRFGSPKRFGAMTIDGRGECVGGIAMMLKGANANAVTKELEKRVERVQKMLPEGVSIVPYLNRSELVKRNIFTVIRNLAEGALIVFLVLMIFLGDVRAGFIVASVIPLALLFAFIMMRFFGVTANLMSLGAIDFGIVIDGPFVIIEGVLAYIYSRRFFGRTLTKEQFNNEIVNGAALVARSAFFGVLIVIIVFFTILYLKGIEGKTFTPMAKTLIFCISGALILSLTYVPMMASLLLKRQVKERRTFSDRFFERLNRVYRRVLNFTLRHAWKTLATAFLVLAASIVLFTRLGAEFIPTLDEGDFAMQMTLPAGSSLSRSIEVSGEAQQILLDRFPEIRHVVAKIGTAEVPTDPMAIEDADVMIIMKPFREWTSARSRAEMVDRMKDALEEEIDDVEFIFSQPIQLRFNELMTGAKADIAIKLFGEDMDELYARAVEAAGYVEQVPGAADVLVERALGLPQLVITYDRSKLARHGVSISELNTIIRAAYAGEKAGTVFENERRFDLVVRLDREKVPELNIDRLFVRTAEGIQIPVSEVASVDLVSGPLQINRDDTKRRIVIGVNVRDADIQHVVERIRELLEQNITLKPGYYFEYGGQFENLQNAINTLLVVVPIALFLILLLLFISVRSIAYTLIIFTTVPLSIIGGVLALWVRGMPFSITAGVGFIALFGVSVITGILMINHFLELARRSKYRMTTLNIIRKGTPRLLRPVFLTGLTTALGFVPMAVATSAGAEVQRPLATVVIGGVIVSTLLTLIIIPIFYYLVNSSSAVMRKSFMRKIFRPKPILPLLLVAMMATPALAQQTVTLEQAVAMAKENDPRLKSAEASIEVARASRGASWELSNTSVDYSWGQLNGLTRNDRQLNVVQSVGSVITPFYKNALAERQIVTGQRNRDIVEKEITAEVTHAYVYYLYTLGLVRIYGDMNSFAEQLLQTGELRYRTGDITLLERNMIATQAATMRSKAFQAGEEHRLAAARLQWACFSDTSVVPSDAVLMLLPVRSLDGPLGETYRAYHNSLAEEARVQVSIERSRLFPELSAGYMRQNILPDKGLNAWTVGITVPLFFTPQKSRIKQARLNAEVARYDAQTNIRELNNKLETVRADLRRYGETVEFYRISALSEAEALIAAAKLQLEHNDTDISQFIQSMNNALEIKRAYAEAIYLYNVAVIEYELYQ
ncbi:MAG: CusA/CzcA family heavy metal efflux RND transporter [Rikenellaceae bacterium]|nr:CusA/CzcA family heavy metal efflux RND transporter [Rikenellaceae bacterium]MCL2692721.1 CusA/CzcA family heavy metal efflux RND transporter [Rikenellaceae bacterium]